MDDRELAVLRKQTAAFIADHPVQVTMVENVRAPNGKGGFTVTPTPRQPQTFRKIPVNAGQTSTRNVDGEEVQPKYVLLGAWDTAVADGDTFVIDGHNYRVDFVRDDHRYETWVEATYVG
jgi:hypothetical protein